MNEWMNEKASWAPHWPGARELVDARSKADRWTSQRGWLDAVWEGGSCCTYFCPGRTWRTDVDMDVAVSQVLVSQVRRCGSPGLGYSSRCQSLHGWRRWSRPPRRRYRRSDAAGRAMLASKRIVEDSISSIMRELTDVCLQAEVNWNVASFKFNYKTFLIYVY